MPSSAPQRGEQLPEHIYTPPNLTVVPTAAQGFAARTTLLTPVICDEAVIRWLLDQLLEKAALSSHDVAARLGCTEPNVSQYLRGKRGKPSLLWFLRLAEVCGAKVTLEFPPPPRKA